MDHVLSESDSLKLQASRCFEFSFRVRALRIERQRPRHLHSDPQEWNPPKPAPDICAIRHQPSSSVPLLKMPHTSPSAQPSNNHLPSTPPSPPIYYPPPPQQHVPPLLYANVPRECPDPPPSTPLPTPPQDPHYYAPHCPDSNKLTRAENRLTARMRCGPKCRVHWRTWS